jgi:hypothetical protein
LWGTEDLPFNATQEVGAYDIAYGLTVLDNVFFDGIPVLSASKDSVDVGVAFYKDITFESPTPDLSDHGAHPFKAPQSSPY